MSESTQSPATGLLPLGIVTSLGAVGGLILGNIIESGLYLGYGLLVIGALLGAGAYLGRQKIVPAVFSAMGWVARLLTSRHLVLARHGLVTALGLWGIASCIWLLFGLTRFVTLPQIAWLICAPIGAWVITRHGWRGLVPALRIALEARRQRLRQQATGPGHASATAAGESVMTLHAGSPVELRLKEAIVVDPRRPHLVLRCALARGLPDSPDTVVLKQARVKRRGVFNEWAGLIFASERPGLKRICPALYGADRQLDLLVMEDLGRGPSLQDILVGNVPLLAEAALLEQAETLAHIHAASAGCRDRMTSIRLSLSGESFESDRDLGASMRTDLRTALDATALSPPLGLDEELNTAAARLEEPGALDVFLLRDTRPSNWLRPWLELRPCALTRSCFGLATLDLVGITLGNLTQPGCLGLPPALRQRIIDTYRETLAAELGSAAEPPAFDAALAVAAASWLSALLASIPQAEAEPRLETGADDGQRSRVVAGMETFLELPCAAAQLPLLHETVRGLCSRARDRWGESLRPLPFYPALASTGATDAAKQAGT